jgi:death on curing protein
VDGNKRTGFITVVTFLLLNGFYINASEADVVLVIMQLADGSLTEEALASWFEKVIIQPS